MWNAKYFSAFNRAIDCFTDADFRALVELDAPSLNRLYEAALKAAEALDDGDKAQARAHRVRGHLVTVKDARKGHDVIVRHNYKDGCDLWYIPATQKYVLTYGATYDRKSGRMQAEYAEQEIDL